MDKKTIVILGAAVVIVAFGVMKKRGVFDSDFEGLDDKARTVDLGENSGLKRGADGKIEDLLHADPHLVRGDKPTKPKKRRARAKPKFDLNYEGMDEEDRAWAKAIQDTSDSGSLKDLMQVSEQLKNAKNPAVRMAAVEAIGWYGEKGLSELVAFMGDKDPDVANRAGTLWQLGVSEIDDDVRRSAYAVAAMSIVKDPTVLDDMGMELYKSHDDLLIVQGVADLMQTSNEAAREKAAEIYEDLTGEEWTGEAAAEKWLQENYEPPEPEESDFEEDNNVDTFEPQEESDEEAEE